MKTLFHFISFIVNMKYVVINWRYYVINKNKDLWTFQSFKNELTITNVDQAFGLHELSKFTSKIIRKYPDLYLVKYENYLYSKNSLNSVIQRYVILQIFHIFLIMKIYCFTK